MKYRACAVVANEKGEIFELEGYSAVGMAGNDLYILNEKNSIKIPDYSELMFLPDRAPILFNNKTKQYEIVEFNPYNENEKLFPVAAFNSPGYVITLNSAFDENEDAKPLPLFSYGAVGGLDDDFVSAVYQVDKEDRQDLSLMPVEKVEEGLMEKIKEYPKNRLIYHIKKCALEWGCPAAKNFFLKRYEAPLPTSRVCNANCLGCISLQKDEFISSCQNRINFTPSPEEIAEIALSHIENVENCVLSFGQGCEGDPLLAFDVILPAIKIIRSKTDKGTLNMNTNASLPKKMEELFDAGLDSIRVSTNSFQKKYYLKYFRPKYEFEDVLETIKTAKKKHKFVSVNYLNMPGFTDTEPEMKELFKIIENLKIDFIQWRNLNYDPKLYFRQMFGDLSKDLIPFGIINLIKHLKKNYKDLHHGYFNPPKGKYKINF
ncbi:MAG: radical SAM protein [Desulforegulaceae bacterium]|jgi:wyosine [tRNA(Phe)-imidazoG37] synthetase (radical SAM superfamily)|nr:radical SAM protein [Desulforegulaceae bacterium]